MLRPKYRPSRWLVSALVLCLLTASLVYQPATCAATDLPLGADAEVANAQGDNVNLRDQPSYAGQVLTSVPEGWLVSVQDGPFTDDTDGTVWYQVVARGQSGYMLAEYLQAPGEGAVSAAAVLTTTANLNLRSGPSLTSTVLLVIPNGASVSSTGSVSGDFTQVTYQGTTGWAATQYLSGGGSSQSATVIGGALNLRSGPGTTYAVITVMPNGAVVTITGSQTNGFYPVTYNGTAGYASATYLQVGGSGSQSATVIGGALNLRSGPGTTYAVITVMPNGAVVTITGSQTSGFYPVTYNGTAGYASATYLQLGGTGPSPTPSPTATAPAVDTATVIDGSLNLRSGPGTSYSVIAVMPGGSTVSITGAQTNGFYPVRYNGLNGYASATYLQLSSQPTPTPTQAPTQTAWTTANLNLRSGAGTGFSVVTVIPSGSQITITGSLTNNYYPATYGNNSGFVSADFITFTQPTTPTPGTGGLLIWPVKGGEWQIIQGYNGGTHNGSTYMYSFDLQLTAGEQATIGQPIYAPASGTVLWTNGGILIGMGNGYGIALFHTTPLSGITAGTVVTQGQQIATISGPGGTGYQVTPHVDMTLWELPNGGGTPRISTPYTGQFAVSGQSFPPGDLAFNTWGGTIIYP